jgi:hypothetical protein
MSKDRIFNADMTYREALLETALTLKQFLTNIECRMYEITMTGELKEWSDTVPDGETHEVGLDVFEACSDVNVRMFVDLWEAINTKYESFLNINNISVDEINEFEEEKYNIGEEEIEDNPINKFPNKRNENDSYDDLPF